MRSRLYHKAALIGQNGEVCALCYKTPHAIDMTKRVSWTIRWEAVTCPKCLALRGRESEIRATLLEFAAVEKGEGN
jgi:hypothetical protein